MAIQGADNNQPKTIEDYKNLADTVKVEQDSEKLQKNLSIFSSGATAAIEEALPDGIDASEARTLSKWQGILQSVLGSIPEKFIDLCEDIIDVLDKTLSRINDLIATAEPEETDAESEPAVPKRMPWSSNQSDIESVYNDLLNPGGTGPSIVIRNKPAAKASALIGFIAKYGNRLSKNQLIFVRNQIKEFNYQAKSDNANIQLKPLDVQQYWAIVKTAGYKHDIRAELKVLGYTDQEIKQIVS